MDQKLQWKTLELEKHGAKAPSARTYFSMVTHVGKLWVFGGFGDGKGRFNDFYAYNPVKDEWRPVTNEGKVPQATYFHTATVYDNKMWLFGGSVGQQGNDSNSLYSFDFGAKKWSLIEPSSYLGYPPTPRYGHAACVCDGKLIIMGGCQRSTSYLQDAYQYNFANSEWKPIAKAPLDLAFHSLFAYKNQCYLFGGFNGKAYNTKLYVLKTARVGGLLSWEVVPTTGPEPTPRCGCGLAVMSDKVWIFGGYTAKGHLNDLHMLDLKTMTWVSGDAGNRPASRAYLQAAELDGNFYIFGGYGSTNCISDFRCLPVAPRANMGRVLLEQSVSQQVEYAIRHFGAGDAMGRKELEQMFSNLSVTLSKLLEERVASDVVAGAASKAFDTSILPEALALGFAHDDIMSCMSQLHKEGKATNNMDVLVERLLSYTAAKKEEKSKKKADDDDVPGMPGLERQKSERAELREKLQTVIDEKKDMMSCKICFERNMDCVLLPCGHLTSCKVCADELRAASRPCPICSKAITNNISVYWS